MLFWRIFLQNANSIWQFFSFSTLKILFHHNLASTVLLKKSANNLILLSLKVMWLLFGCLQGSFLFLQYFLQIILWCAHISVSPISYSLHSWIFELMNFNCEKFYSLSNIIAVPFWALFVGLLLHICYILYIFKFISYVFLPSVLSLPFLFLCGSIWMCSIDLL